MSKTSDQAAPWEVRPTEDAANLDTATMPSSQGNGAAMLEGKSVADQRQQPPDGQGNQTSAGAPRFANSSLLDMLNGSINGPSFVPNRPSGGHGGAHIQSGPPAETPTEQVIGVPVSSSLASSILPPYLGASNLQRPAQTGGSARLQGNGLNLPQPAEARAPPALLRESQQAQSLESQGEKLEGGTSEADQVTKEKRQSELHYQNTYYRLRKTLLNKVDEFQSTLMAKGTELLPPEYWAVPPQVLVMTVSSYGKVFSHMSEGLKQNKDLKALVQEVNNCLTRSQLEAIHSSKQQAEAGKTSLPKTVQFGRLRKKSDFSRMQALFGFHFRNVLLPKALAAVDARVSEVIDQGFSGKRAEAVQKVEEAGFQLHKTAECKQGCPQCYEFRRSVQWPGGVPLLKNPAAYQKNVLNLLCTHYNLHLDEQSAQPDDCRPGALGETCIEDDAAAIARRVINGEVTASDLLLSTGGADLAAARLGAASKPHTLSPGWQRGKRKERGTPGGEHSEALEALLQVTAAQQDTEDQSSMGVRPEAAPPGSPASKSSDHAATTGSDISRKDGAGQTHSSQHAPPMARSQPGEAVSLLLPVREALRSPKRTKHHMY